MKERQYQEFLKKIEKGLLDHRIIKNNPYCSWFKNTELTTEQVKALTVQFSIFSNWFLVAQLKKTINEQIN